MSEELNGQLKQAQDHIKGLVAQLDATKQMLNENINSNLQLRSTLVILQQNAQEQAVKSSSLADQVNKLTNDLNEANAKLSVPQPE